MENFNTFSTQSTRWQALVERNQHANNSFVYGVLTTNIYCRPICTSRLPKQENVKFFDNWQMAESKGFRACKRCSPQLSEENNPTITAIISACKIIETAENLPSLNDLAKQVGLSQYHFHRLFKKIVGLTPKQYSLEKRLSQVRANLQSEPSITQTLYNARFESSSRFYETAKSSLGMKPRKYRSGGSGVTICYAIAPSYLGYVLVAATEQGICKIDFGDSPEFLEQLLKKSFPNAKLQSSDPSFQTVVEQVLAFLETPNQTFSLPLDIQGTAFQRRVWTALQNIAPGTTTSYSEIASQIGNPKAVRAVAQACAANNIAVVIPCHRVVRNNGNLGGYKWGISRKQDILTKESANLACEKQ